MVVAGEPVKAEERRASQPKVGRYTGQVVYIYAFDVAYDMAHEPVGHLLGQPLVPFVIGTGKRTPKQLFFYQPRMVRLPEWERVGPLGPMRLQCVLKLLPVGALSITVRTPFSVARIEDLVAFHDLRFSESTLHSEVRRLAEQAVAELRGILVRPQPQLPEEEAYTVFCLESPLLTPEGLKISAESWFQAHRRQTAALLTQEENVERLSKQEADESTGRYLSYYEDDLVVLDWDAALLIDEPADFDETLYIMELANLQLAELEAYDRIVDDALERAYRDLGEQPLRSRAGVLRELRELRIDLARLNDELLNITKFFGDWHLARIYEKLAARFHLGEWHRTLDGKLRTLDELYQILQHDKTNRWMLALESLIVLLFIVDLVVLIFGFKGP